ncbi:mucin-17-like isoform X22 [Patiria miniata]|uniref:Hyalin n=1 Tax=Patiria miniata TaxID=46514 RepID=A0A914AZB6_PATMI|nr:mucin-17-like isoform X22 [Patiria miniata]
MMAAFRISVVCALLALLPTPIMSQGTCQCENGGQCLYDETGAGIRCVCPVGYRGILCDIQDANCLCENGGICSINAEDDYVCSCMEGYDGPLCQYVPLVDDKSPPDIFNCPSDFEARRQPGEDSVYVTWEEPYATDNSGEVPSVFRNIAPNFYARSNYDVQVFYRYTDQTGLTSECRFTVTVIYSDGSDPRPVVSGCPSNINVTAMGSLRTAVDWVEPTLGSTGQVVISVDRSHVPGSLFFLGSTPVTYTFLSDTNQVMSMCTFTVTVTTDSCRCENGGICIPDEVKSGVMCMCPAGYSGILCQESACQCLNGGMCVREAGNTVMCTCPRGYRGVLCEQMDDQCDCENGGTCVHDATVPGGTMCICPAGFGGILCNESTSVDTVPPTVTFCPESFNLNPNSSDPIAATWPQPRAEDDSGLAPSVDQNVPVGTLMNPGDVLDVVYKFTDAAGNSAFCNFTITFKDRCDCENGGTCVHDTIVPGGTRCICPAGFAGILCSESTSVDTVPPTVTFCPESFNLNPISNDPIAATWPQPRAEDDSGLAPSVDLNVLMGTLVNLGDVLDIVYKFTDAAGNVAFCNFTITAVADVDTVPPTVTFCPESFNVSLTSSEPIAATWPQPEAEDDSGLAPTVDQNIAMGTLMSLGDVLDVVYKFSDAAGNAAFCNFTVTVVGRVDTIPPTVTFCPESFNLSLTSSEPIAATWTQPEAEDDSGLAPSVDQNVPMGTLMNLGDVLDVVYKFTDAAGNVAFCNFTITAVGRVDTAPPTITFCPESFNLSLTSSEPIAATWPQPEAEDDSGLAPSVDQNVPMGTLMSLGDVLNVVYNFTDAAGNVAFCNFTITAVDDIPPTIRFCPSNIENLAPNPTAMIFVTWAMPQVSDNLGGPLRVLASSLPGIFVMAGSAQTVTYVFTDESGNEARCMFNIVITVLESPKSVSLIDVTTTSAMLSVVPPNATFDSYVVKVQDQELTFPATESILPLSDLMPGTNYQVLVSTAISYGTSNQVISEPFNLEFTTVALDMTLPVISGCPSDITLPAGQNVANWTEPTAVDNSGLVPAVIKSHEPGAVFADESTNVSYTFTDAAGNTAKCVFTVTRILVLEPPMSVSLINVTTTYALLSLAPPNVNFDLYIVNVQSPTLGTDVNIPATESTVEIPGLMPGTNYTVSVSTAVAYGTDNEVISEPISLDFITVLPDTTVPVISGCPSDITLPAGQNVANWTEPTAVDNSGLVPAVIKSHEPGAVFADESTNVSYTFTDAAGNMAKCVFIVKRILVLEPPMSVSLINVTTTSALLSLAPPNVNFDLYIVNAQSPTSGTDVNIPATENTVELLGLMPGTNYTVSVSTAVAYGTDNEVISEPVSLDFTTVSLDMTRPVISGCPSDITLPAGQNVANWTEPTAIDNSGLVPAVNKSHEPGAVFANESTNVSYTFTDAAGNMAKCVFTVTRILVLDPPSSISITDVTSSMAFVTWTPPNSTFDVYLVVVQGSNETTRFIFPKVQDFILLPNLTSNTNYTVSVSTAVALGTVNEILSEPVVVTVTTMDAPDTMPPVVTGCPSDITLPAGQNVANWTEPTAVDNSGLVPAVNKSHEPGAVFADESTNVSYTFSDAAGNMAKCVFTVTRILVLDPPGSISITDVTSSLAFLTWTPPNSTFDVYLVVVQGSNETRQFTTPKVQNSIVLPNLTPNTNYTVSVSTAVAYGTANEIVSQPVSVTLTVLDAPDTMPPMVTGCPSDITLPAGQNVANWTEPTAVDNSGLVPAVIKSHEPGAVFADESTNVSYTFTDAAGNMAKCVFTVTRLFDLTPPVVSGCPDNITLPLGATVANWTEPTATDDSGSPPSVLKSHVPGASFLEGNTNVTYTFTDGVGNQAVCAFLVTVTFDVTRPVVSGCPDDITLPLGATIANWTEPTATDDSGSPPSVLKSHAPGASFLEGNTNVTYTFTDGVGNQAVCAFLVTVTFDVTRPVVSGCPDDITLPLGATIANWTEPTATDDSGSPPSVLKSHVPGASFLEGNTNVTYTFTDGVENQAVCAFLVTVTFDLTPPVVSGCPDNITLPLGATVANWTEPTATDDSGSPPSVLKSHAPGTSFLEGNTNVTYTFTDGVGNQAVCAFLVTVTFDKTAPVISNCPGNILLPFASTLASWTEPTATDNSGEPPSVTKTHEPGTEFSDGNTTVAYTFTDAAGNQANCSFVVNVVADDVAPFILNCPSNISLPFGTDTASWTEPTATDNSGQVPSVDRSHEPGAVFTEDSTMVTYTFTDAMGNQANCVFLVIRLRDDIRPEITTCPSIINLTPGTNVATWDEPTATDNSGEIPTFTRTHEPGSVFTENVTMVVYTFTDAAGNEALCVFFVKLAPVDMPPMIFNCPSDFTMTLLLSEIDLGIFFTWREPFAIDDSGLEPTVNKTHSPGIMFPAGSTRVVYTFTDNAGNQAECAFVVNVLLVDDIRPVITGCPSDMDVTLPLTQQSDIMVTWQEPSATDNSGAAPSLDRSHQPGETFPEGRTTVTYTFSDQTGNEAVCSFEINVQREEDVTPPQILNCPLDQAYVIPAGNQFMIIMWNPPTAIDNSGVPPAVVSNRIPGDVFGIGETVVMYNFTDPSDNMATCEFTIKLSTPVLNPCQSSPCRPNENCFYSATTFICVAGPFRKRRDVLDMKDDVMDICPCENGGVCLKETGSKGTRCICPEGLTGILCKEAGDKGDETALQSSWKFLGLTSLGALSLLVAMLLAVFHIKRQRTGKLGYDISSMAF